MTAEDGVRRPICVYGCVRRVKFLMRPGNRPGAKMLPACGTHWAEQILSDPNTVWEELPEVPFPFDPEIQTLTPVAVEKMLLAFDDALASGTEFLKGHEERFSDAKHQYTMEYARAYMASEARNETARKSDALLKCERLLDELRLSELVCRTIRDEQHNLRSRVEIWRSLGASVRVSFQNAS